MFAFAFIDLSLRFLLLLARFAAKILFTPYIISIFVWVNMLRSTYLHRPTSLWSLVGLSFWLFVGSPVVHNRIPCRMCFSDCTLACSWSWQLRAEGSTEQLTLPNDFFVHKSRNCILRLRWQVSLLQIVRAYMCAWLCWQCCLFVLASVYLFVEMRIHKSLDCSAAAKQEFPRNRISSWKCFRISIKVSVL